LLDTDSRAIADQPGATTAGTDVVGVVAVVVVGVVAVVVVVAIAVVAVVVFDVVLGAVVAVSADVVEVVTESDPHAAASSTNSAAMTDDLDRALMPIPPCVDHRPERDTSARDLLPPPIGMLNPVVLTRGPHRCPCSGR
jgi:hypothetical protein